MMAKENEKVVIPRGIRIWDRRVEMLRQALQGIRPSAIIRSIQDNEDLHVGVSDSTLWDDWTKREEWMPILLNIRKDVAELPISEAFAGLLEARRLAFNLYLRATNDFAKVGALREIRENIKAELTLRQSMGLTPKVAEKHDVVVDTKKYMIILSDVGAESWEKVKEDVQVQEEAESEPGDSESPEG